LALDEDLQPSYSRQAITGMKMGSCCGLTQQSANKHKTVVAYSSPSPPVGWGRETDKRADSWAEIKTV